MAFLSNIAGTFTHINPVNLSIATLFLISAYALFNREASALRRIPGPFLASISKLWIVKKEWSFRRHEIDMELHRRYGPIVRIAPNEVMVSSPKSFRKIYGAGSNFSKSSWYEATSDRGWQGPDTLDFLPEQNMEKYRRQRRAIGPAYTAEAAKDYEENLNEILKKDIGIMRGRAGQSVDIDLFFNMFASDCLATATFSKSKNMVEAGKDDGSISAVHSIWFYIHIMGYFPFLHMITTWFTNRASTVVALVQRFGIIVPFITATNRQRNFSNSPFAFPISQVQSRMQARSAAPSSPNDAPTDVIGKLFQLQSTKAALKDKDHWIQNICLTNFGAGVETIAITVHALLTNVVSHPGCQERIHAEIDAARKKGILSEPPRAQEMGEALPYLDACLRESQRLHGIIGMPLARVVSQGGCELEGWFIPASTTVGINMWVLNRDKSLYGADADEWRPERWLEFSKDKLRSLGTYNMGFGAGARSCPGKYLAQAIYKKMIPMLFENFEWSFSEPEKEKVMRTAFTVRYVELMMKWKVRESGQ